MKPRIHRVQTRWKSGFMAFGARPNPRRAAGGGYGGPAWPGRRRGPFQRHPGAGQVLLGQRDEQAVDHGELGDPAGGGAGPEGGLAGRGDQHQVRDLGDRRPREVGHRDGGGTLAARLATRVDRVDGGAGVRQADRDVPAAAQRGRRDGQVRSGQANAGRPIRCSFICRSRATKPLAPRRRCRSGRPWRVPR